MLVKVNSVTPFGIEIKKISIEVNVSNRGFPNFDIVGLPGKEVSESKHRILTALSNSDLALPSKKIVVNLAPAGIPKKGSYFDLPIAIGLVAAEKKIPLPKSSIFFGEVSLDGKLRHSEGAFLVSLCAKDNDLKNIFVPYDCVEEAGSLLGLNVYGIRSLKQLVGVLKVGSLDSLRKKDIRNKRSERGKSLFDFADVVGQESAKRALEISAAGGHNLLLEGPPGVGKTMLAKAYSSLLPNLEYEESIEVTKIHSIRGLIPKGGSIMSKRPYRAPHHTTSYSGMIGGGSIPKPGEISLAHNGVLFMDEFPEFSRQVLESLRQPLEEGEVTITRSKGTFTFPSKFALLASCNPCPCGYYGHNRKRCLCTIRQIENYRKKLSGPIADRLDLFVYVNEVDVNKLSESAKSEPSNAIKERVEGARKVQSIRFRDSSISLNTQMTREHLDKFCKLNNNTTALLNQVAVKLNLSARAYYKTIKVSRTIADLSSSLNIEKRHITEAIQYRSRI